MDFFVHFIRKHTLYTYTSGKIRQKRLKKINKIGLRSMAFWYNLSMRENSAKEKAWQTASTLALKKKLRLFLIGKKKREGEAACKVFYKMRRVIGRRILIFVCIPNHLYHYKVFTGGKKYEQKICLHVQRRECFHA